MNIPKALFAGFVGTAVLSMLMLLKGMMGLMPQLDIIKMLAAMMGSGPAMGWVAHFMIGTVVWGIAYAMLYRVLPSDTPWVKGVIFGIGAWLMMMIVVMPMAGAGIFGSNFGMIAPVMTLLLHIIYGATLGGVYGRPATR
jgi:uncharacterized membrane protein YagU involved in acid resistance